MQCDPHEDPLPPSWQLIEGSYLNNSIGGNQGMRGVGTPAGAVADSRDGFAAIAFVNPATREIVIGFRGSEWEKGVMQGLNGIDKALGALTGPGNAE